MGKFCKNLPAVSEEDVDWLELQSDDKVDRCVTPPVVAGSSERNLINFVIEWIRIRAGEISDIALFSAVDLRYKENLYKTAFIDGLSIKDR